MSLRKSLRRSTGARGCCTTSTTRSIRRRTSIRLLGVNYLREQGWPEEILHAILAHADYSGVKPETHLDRSLYACDELAGFLTACALVKPSKKIAEVEVAGVKKKMKDKAFARAVKREDITHGAELLGIPLEEHIGNCLTAMQARAEELGL